MVITRGDHRASGDSAIRSPGTNTGRERSDVAFGIGQAARPIRTGQLHTLLCFHTQPINLVVYEGSLGVLRPGMPCLEAGFPLRCFQRLSVPYIATRLCPWQDNRHTRGTSNQVLSYYG